VAGRNIVVAGRNIVVAGRNIIVAGRNLNALLCPACSASLNTCSPSMWAELM